MIIITYCNIILLSYIITNDNHLDRPSPSLSSLIKWKRSPNACYRSHTLYASWFLALTCAIVLARARHALYVLQVQGPLIALIQDRDALAVHEKPTNNQNQQVAAKSTLIRLEVCCKLSQHVHAWSSLQTQLFIHCCWKSIDVTRARHLQLGAVSVMPQPCTSKQVIGCCRIGINDLLRLLMPNYGKLRLVLGDMPFEQKRKTY